MFVFEVATLPTRAHPRQRIIARGNGGADLGTARTAIRNALVRSHLTPAAAQKAASQAGHTWTDFPEYGVTIRAYPQTQPAQCAHVGPTGHRCQRVVAVVPDGRTVRCWQH